MSEKIFFGMLTEIGEIKEANAIALGVRRRITEMGVCDGNGAEFLPDRKMRELPGLKRRAPLNSLAPDDKNPAWIIAEQIIPENEGGFWIRGYGLYDEDGDLVAVANCAPSFKPVLSSGSGKTHVIRLVLLVGSVATYELKIDPSVVLAPRDYVDKGLQQKVDKTSVIDVPHGGTGRSSVTAGRYLRGNGALALQEVTPAQVFHDLGINQAILDAIAALGTLSRVYSITGLPLTDVGPIIVREAGEVWMWANTPFFQGYRSPLCGRPVDGHTVTPLPSEVDAVGGVLPKVAYARLWGYAQENGLVVTPSIWTANVGAHYFVDVDANTFRVPDLRNMFRRFTGTDADTANARALGTHQGHSLGSHSHGLTLQRSALGTGSNMPTVNNGNNTYPFNANGQPDLYVIRNDISAAIAASGGTETRGSNVAYHPRIHA